MNAFLLLFSFSLNISWSDWTLNSLKDAMNRTVRRPAGVSPGRDTGRGGPEPTVQAAADGKVGLEHQTELSEETFLAHRAVRNEETRLGRVKHLDRARN